MAEQIELLVRPDRLIEAAAEVSRLTHMLTADFDRMQTLVDRSSYYWLGETGREYRREFAQQKQETREILDRFRDYPDDLLRMAGLYEESERKNAQVFEGLPLDILS